MEWTPYLPWPWQRVRLIDGSRSGWFAHVMRRKVNGRWEYRRMTEEELAAEQRANAW